MTTALYYKRRGEIMCNSKRMDLILGIVILILAIWPVFGIAVSNWIVILAAIILIVCSVACKKKTASKEEIAPKKRPVRKSR